MFLVFGGGMSPVLDDVWLGSAFIDTIAEGRQKPKKSNKLIIK
jgi:hypothetical protein